MAAEALVVDAGIVCLREVIIAATLIGPADSSARQPAGRGQPATVDVNAVFNLSRVWTTARASVPISTAWVAPLVRHGIIPAAAALLQHILRAYRQSPGCFRLDAATLLSLARVLPTWPAVEAEGAKQRCCALLCLRAVVEILEDLANAIAPGPCPDPAAASQLWEQLTAPAVLQALATAVRWVEAEVWPTRRAVLLAGAAAVELASQTLMSVAHIVKYAIDSVNVGFIAPNSSGAASSPSSSLSLSTTHRYLALLAVLRDSDMLSALSAALLAAPRCAAVAPGAKHLGAVTHFLALAQCHVLCTLEDLTSGGSMPWQGLAAATELLAAPAVQRLRWAALEQLAVAAPAAAGQSGAAAELAAGASGRSHARGGGGEGACGEAEHVWLVLQPNVMSLHKILAGHYVHACQKALGAVFRTPGLWAAAGDWTSEGGAAPPNRAARVKAARRLLPPLQRLSALMAACARTLCGVVEVELAKLAAAGPVVGTAGNDELAPGWGSCVVLADQMANMVIMIHSMLAGAAVTAEQWPHLVATAGWGLRAQRATMAIDRAAAAALVENGRSPAGATTKMLRVLELWLHGPHRLEILNLDTMEQLLPTGLLRSVDFRLRQLAAAGIRTEEDRCAADVCNNLMHGLLPDLLMASARAGGAGRAQDELGVMLTAAKLARREGEQPGGTGSGRPPPLPLAIAVGLSLFVEPLGVALTLHARTLHAQQQPGSSGRAGGGGALESTAMREGAALASVTALPILVAEVIAGLGSSSSSSDLGSGHAREPSGRPDGGSGSAARHQRVSGFLATDSMGGCWNCAGLIEWCLAAAVQLLPPDDLLALQPQRTLALLGRLLQRAHELRRPGAGRGRRGTGRGRSGRAKSMDELKEDKMPLYAGEAAFALVRMAADEQLVGVVAGWLQEQAVVAPPPGQEQRQCSGLDAPALAAALRHWDAAAADVVMRLHAAAADANSAEGSGRGSGSRDPGAAASGGVAATRLLAAARDALAHRHGARGALAQGQGGRVWSLPDDDPLAWPPRLLRLCGNPACGNFAGSAEAELPLRKCSGCKAVRYCGADCQAQDWRDGGHGRECARLRAAREETAAL